MSTIGYINVALESFGALLSLILIICLIISETRRTRLNRVFIGVLICNIAVLLSDAVAWIFKGNVQPYGFFLVRVANFCVFSFGYLILAMFTNYLVTYIGTKTYVNRRIVHVMMILCGIAIGLVILSQFNGMYYAIDEGNYYCRGSWFWLSQVYGILCLLLDLVMIVYYRKFLTRRELVFLMSHIILPILAMAVQIFVYGIALLYIATTFAALTVYLGIQVEQANIAKQQEIELTESRVAIMISQIQPHFLYNSLVVIKQLCDIDPQQAKEAVVEFSDYLRANLDSLSHRQNIPFIKELEHVKNYLALEQRRFGERLVIQYDIQTIDFSLPALSLQPIAENAVKYGSTSSFGREIVVLLRSEDKGTMWQITVADNGDGFPQEGEPKDGRSHVGIANVRSRLQTMCSGTLTIESQPGHGTSVIIKIPKTGRAAEDTPAIS